MLQKRTFDLVLFGATGFTGRLVAEYLVQHGGQLRWALAGRDREKLQALREHLGPRAGGSSYPEVLVADAADPRALGALAASARVVISTVGPYLRYGEPLVKACAERGTHYVDLTGEPEFVHLVRERYHATAIASGAKIVNSCGFDSIPHDLGAYFTLQALRRRLTAEQANVPIAIEGFVRARGTFSGGTWHSAIGAMSTKPTPKTKRATPVGDGRKVGALSSQIRYRKDLGAWAVPMPTIDPQVVRSSARMLPEYGPDFRYGHYLRLKHWHQVAGLLGGIGAVFMLAQVRPTRALLLKWKDPGDGPDRATREKGWFEVTFVASGGGQTVRCAVRGGDPGYGETAKMLAESALCLAFDGDALPPQAGVVSTAVAMGNPLIARLQRAGITFEEQA